MDQTNNVTLNEEVEVEKVVSTADFPEKSSRLQQLMSDFQKEKGIVAPQPKGNPLAGVKVKKEVKVRTYNDLKPEEQKKVLAKIEGVDYLKTVDIRKFGSTKQSPMTTHAKVIISKYSSSDFGELADPLTELFSSIKSHNPIDIVKDVNLDGDRKWGALSSIKDMISMKRIKKKMYRALSEHSTIAGNLDAIEVELKKQELDFQKDISIYEEMGKNTYLQVADFEYAIIALQLMKDDAEELLNSYVEKGELDLIEINQATTIKKALERLDRKMISIKTVQVSTIQCIPQLLSLIDTDDIICEKIEEVSELVIPLWSWQYAIAIGALKAKEALSLQKAIRGVTSKLITGNAKLLHDNMIAAQEELYQAAMAIEDLAIVQNYINEMYSKVNEVKKKMQQKSVDEMNSLIEIENSNYKLLSEDITK